jgi:hypothetical protein
VSVFLNWFKKSQRKFTLLVKVQQCFEFKDADIQALKVLCYRLCVSPKVLLQFGPHGKYSNTKLQNAEKLVEAQQYLKEQCAKNNECERNIYLIKILHVTKCKLLFFGIFFVLFYSKCDRYFFFFFR